MAENMLKVTSTGAEMEVAPRGAFAREYTKVYARIIAQAALSPLEDYVREAQRLSPELDAEAGMTLANTLRAADLNRKLTATVGTLLGEENVLYRLAACALRQPVDWAEEMLLPYEAARAVKMAMDIGGMGEYLGESLVLLGGSVPTEGPKPEATPEPTPEPSSVECVR